jgi:riboflavin transporter
MDNSHKLSKENILIHNRLSTKYLVLASVFVGINIVLTRLGAIMLFSGSVRLSFGNIPLILSGMMLGPTVGAMTGVVSDLLGFLINSHGSAFHPGFTLSAALTGFVPGMVTMLSFKNKYSLFNVILSNLLIYFIISAGLNTYWLTHLIGQGFFILFPARLITHGIITLINIPIILILVKALKQTHIFNN